MEKTIKIGKIIGLILVISFAVFFWGSLVVGVQKDKQQAKCRIEWCMQQGLDYENDMLPRCVGVKDGETEIVIIPPNVCGTISTGEALERLFSR